jgi:serine/threonine-protein kinase
MMFSAGTKIGVYEILGSLGAGGMGEVYRARDTKLKRDVALKVLPESFAGDPERMIRFQREAEVLAALNHPNIAQIYGVEDRALVMELVEGETLKGPLPVDRVLDYARQIADALGVAHEKGIVHRDLKPANIKITPAGVVKVLDFGLAKAAEEPAGDPQNSPTQTVSPTRMGMILGTAAYMSPEQARGKPVDKRADIWAFGCVLYEVLNGGAAFTGETITDVLAAVVTKEPDYMRVPPQMRRLLQRCLAKDPKKRLQAIGDFELLLEQAPQPVRRSALPWAIAALFGILAAGGSWVAWRATRPVQHPLVRLNVDLGPDAMAGLNTTIAISPDGTRIVYLARGPDGKQQLATRPLNQAQATLLPGTENGADPFFSPDGQWLGFFASGQLKKISIEGSALATLCAANNGQGASWGEDGNIVVALSNIGGLSRVSSAGGTVEPLTKVSPGEATHRWPQVLPGGKAVLFSAHLGITGMDDASIEVVQLKTGEKKILVRGGYFGRYLPSGHLVYIHQGVLFGVPFDVAHLKLLGTPSPLLEDMAGNPILGGGQFDFSRASFASGTFTYLAGRGGRTWPVVWLDSSGKTKPLVAAPGVYNFPRFSPDGHQLALVTNSSNGTDLSIYDLQRETMARLTFSGRVGQPVWTPDGKHIVFRSLSSDGAGLLSWIRADGAGETQPLLTSGNSVYTTSFSPDGKHLAYVETNAETGQDIWTLPLDISEPDHPKPGKPELFLGTPSNERNAVFSPDGRWIAYCSDESGIHEIYVRPFPSSGGGKWQISVGGFVCALV